MSRLRPARMQRPIPSAELARLSRHVQVALLYTFCCCAIYSLCKCRHTLHRDMQRLMNLASDSGYWHDVVHPGRHQA